MSNSKLSGGLHSFLFRCLQATPQLSCQQPQQPRPRSGSSGNVSCNNGQHSGESWDTGTPSSSMVRSYATKARAPSLATVVGLPTMAARLPPFAEALAAPPALQAKTPLLGLWLQWQGRIPKAASTAARAEH